MKYRITRSGPFSLSTASFAMSLCQEKEQDIQREISYAEKHNNQHRIDGLKSVARSERQLYGQQAACRSSGKIAEQKDEIAERRQDLQEAKEKGDAEKLPSARGSCKRRRTN